MIRKHFSISFNQTIFFKVKFEHFQAFLHSTSNCVNYEDNKTRFHAMFFIFTIKSSTTSPNSRTVSNKGVGGQFSPSFWQISQPYSQQGGRLCPRHKYGFLYLPTALDRQSCFSNRFSHQKMYLHLK